MKNTKYVIENKKFTSTIEAAEFLKIKPQQLRDVFKNRDDAVVNGYKASRVYKRSANKGDLIICREANTRFDSQVVLANYLRVPQHVLSKAFSTSNIWSAPDGKKYERIKISKKYPNTQKERNPKPLKVENINGKSSLEDAFPLPIGDLVNEPTPETSSEPLNKSNLHLVGKVVPITPSLINKPISNPVDKKVYTVDELKDLSKRCIDAEMFDDVIVLINAIKELRKN